MKKTSHFCCKGCRTVLYKKYPDQYYQEGLELGHGWHKGKSKANGDILLFGRPRSDETKKRISQAMSGRTLSDAHKRAVSEARINLYDSIGRIGRDPARRGWQYARWRRAVYKRDEKTCQVCGDTEDTIFAHHILSWKDYPELRYELSNGIALCRTCHNKLHKNRGRNVDCDILR